MNLGALILKNVLRQRTRTLLTLLGISIGIATILALGAVADGLKESMGGVIKPGDSDFSVVQAGSSDMTFSRLSDTQLDDIRNVDGVERVEGINLAMTQYGANPFFFIIGVTDRGVDLGGFDVVEGRMIEQGTEEIALGKLAATTTGLGVGDTIALFDRSYEIVGVYETGEQLEDGGSVMPMATVQEMTGTEGQVTLAFVKAEDEADIGELTERIDREFEGEMVTIKSADEISRADQGVVVIEGASWMISALAIIIGGIGVMNTMIISVFDRIREIGVLKAVGWKRRTVLLMILGEAVLIGLAAVVVGSGLAMLVLVPLSKAEVVQAFLTPSYSWALWGRATGVAILVAVVGGLYPAWRAANLSPVEALRYE